MKKLYLLAVFALLSATASFAQSLDLELKVFVQDTVKVKVNNTTDTTYVAWAFINHGPDSLTIADTIQLLVSAQGAIYNVYLTSGSFAQGDTMALVDAMLLSDTSWNEGVGLWCDSAWATNSAGAVITDPDPTNNTSCQVVYVKMMTTGVAELEGKSVSNLNIFPNPATNNVSFTYNFRGEDANVLVRDITGRVVYQQAVTNTYGEKTINVNAANFSNGMYVVELNTAESRNVGRVLIQK